MICDSTEQEAMKVNVTDRAGNALVLECAPGDRLMEVLVELDLVEATCGGECSCVFASGAVEFPRCLFWRPCFLFLIIYFLRFFFEFPQACFLPKIAC